ncbi:MAG: YdcF family protein [Azoarcus sp.]|jgi:uncharacterized SAM-binding protein YcdF (DUF218 family)|nr:YdcF family protein [Azoarcus sp.]
MESTLPLFLFWMKKTIAAFILPPLLPFLFILAGLLCLWRRRRGGVALVWAGLIVGLLTSTPAVVDGLLSPLEPATALQMDAARDAQAIVVLGGGRAFNAPEYGGGDTVSRLTLERLRYGAKLARATGLPVLVTGGAPAGGGAPEARLMKAVLEEEFNVPVRWAEESSLDTRQNARNSAVILKEAGAGRVLLVTHAAHMRRAQEEFEAQGIAVTAAPTAWLGGRHDDNPLPSLPNPNSFYGGWYALHEWLGLVAYRMGR